MDNLILIEAINERNLDKVKTLIYGPSVRINDVDKDGMSPLQHACFKGDIDIVDILINIGADVNVNDHKMGYTCLMFAALSGNEDVVHILLNAGAKTHHKNSVGRTASQMAAFVGHHKIATIINNYVDKSNIVAFSIPSGVNKVVKLPPSCINSVHKLVNEINFSPIKVCLTMRNECLVSAWKDISNVFNHISRQNFDPHNTNEGLSIKFHLISFVCSKAGAAYEDGDKDLGGFIRKLISSEGQEKLLRQGLREFMHIESQLYRIIISELCKVVLGSHPTALEILSNRINGQGFFRNVEDKLECSTCSSYSTNNKRCSACSQVAYCDTDCQKLHWFVHKRFCKQFRDSQSSGMEGDGLGDCDIKCRNVRNKHDDVALDSDE